MAETLTPISPAQGLLPITTGSLTLSEVVPEAITSLMAPDGRTKDLPAPGEVWTQDGRRTIWSGRGQALVLGSPHPIPPGIVQTNQSDAWCVMALDGTAVAPCLARLTPLDLRLSEFPVGTSARSLLGHMNALFVRDGADRFMILVFRSMARTAVHDLSAAMAGLHARHALRGETA
ncbi:MAG: sarcosine oxidase subunit gamma [Pseudomonadota bacterium]